MFYGWRMVALVTAMRVLGGGLHNYGFTAGKDTIWTFYSCMGFILALGFIAMVVDKNGNKSDEAA